MKVILFLLGMAAFLILNAYLIYILFIGLLLAYYWLCLAVMVLFGLEGYVVWQL